MTEIEIKAHVTDHAATEKTIRKIARFSKETVKKDIYWKKDAAGPAVESTESVDEPKPVKVRIRDEDGQTTVTYKRKELQGPIEVNDEQEFVISDRRPFETLLTDIGFAPYVSKGKKTRSFNYVADGGTAVTIELSQVEGLGWFVELEILADSPDGAETARAQEILRRTLALCGIGEEAIESRYYTELLAGSRECQFPKK